MGWPSNIQEILRISAPILIFFTLLIYASSSCGSCSPFTLELLLNCIRELAQINRIRRENSKEEWSLFFFLVLCLFCIWYNHVMNWLFVMLRSQPATLSDFSLTKSLKSFRCFKNNIFFADLPKSISLRFDSNNHEVHWNIRPLRNFFILLHQTNN